MLRILFLMLVVISSVTFAQKQAKPQAIIIDEFGSINYCDLSARIDNLMITLKNNPKATGVIIAYRGADILPGNYDNPVSREFQKHFMFRNHDISRVEIIDGGFRNKFETEFWLVPFGAEMPKPSKTIPKPKLPISKTFIYDRNYLDSGYYDMYSDDVYEYALDEYLLPAVKSEREAERKVFEQELKTQNDSQNTTEENKIEPPTPEEIEADKLSWLTVKFGDAVKSKKDLSGVIIFYADDEIYDIGKLQTLIDEGRRKIAKEAKIAPTKIQIFFGGYRNLPEAEFWIVPKNGEFPTPTPSERQPESNENDSN